MEQTNPFRQFISDWADLVRRGRDLPLGTACARREPGAPEAGKKALLFSPHPDDEVVIGALPLRLQRQSGWKVVNVAVTLGSKKSRRQERLRELTRCCECIGFDVIQAAPDGFENINPAGREKHAGNWTGAVERVAQILLSERPSAIFFPHAKDWNSTHEGTHLLMKDSLSRVGDRLDCLVVETEFWGAMADPNLMVESAPEEVGDLIAALTFHAGEVRRNPYHVMLPAWMADNVRRGSELVGGQGEAAPDYLFATLYRVSRWRGGRLVPGWEGGRTLPAPADPAAELEREGR